MASPFSAIPDELAGGGSASILLISDSLGDGYGDGEKRNGWIGRLGEKLAARYGCRCQLKNWDGTRWDTEWTVSYAGDPANGTLSIWNGSVGGTGTVTHLGWLDAGMLNNVPTPTVILHGSTANDYYKDSPAGSLAQVFVPLYIGRMKTLVSRVQGIYPGVPFVATSQSPFGFWPFINFVEVLRESWRNACGFNSWPADPWLRPITVTDGFSGDLWYFNLLPSINGGVWSSTYWMEGLHPNALGYAAQAQWMYEKIVADLPSIGGGGTPATLLISPDNLGALTFGVGFSQQLTATSGVSEWSVISGALPPGLILNGATGVISGTPTSVGSYSFTVKATGAGAAEKIFTGTVAVPSSFVAAGEAKLKVRLSGTYYPAVFRPKVNGSFVVGKPRI